MFLKGLFVVIEALITFCLKKKSHKVIVDWIRFCLFFGIVTIFKKNSLKDSYFWNSHVQIRIERNAVSSASNHRIHNQDPSDLNHVSY